MRTREELLFCAIYVETHDPREAYRAAFDADDLAPDVIAERVGKLLAKDEIVARLTGSGTRFELAACTLAEQLDNLAEIRISRSRPVTTTPRSPPKSAAPGQPASTATRRRPIAGYSPAGVPTNRPSPSRRPSPNRRPSQRPSIAGRMSADGETLYDLRTQGPR